MTRRIALGAPETWPAVVAEVATALERDEVVVLPAEGLYGYHALAGRRRALAALQHLKPREPGRGWITLVRSLDDARGGDVAWITTPTPDGEALAREHWPGALTLVLPSGPGAPDELTSEDGTIALRSPGSPFLQAILAATGAAIVTTSANRPGGRPPTTLGDCALEGVGLAVDGGPLAGVPSTIVRVVGGRVEVLRPGAVRIGGDPP